MRVQLHNITKKFYSLRRTHNAVDNISLHIRDKEFFVLLGPSGCGKSTTLNLIAGLEKPSAGKILFDETEVASADKRIFYTPKQRNVAMVFQSYALYPHLNVYDNIAFPLRIAKQAKADIALSVDKAARTLKLSHLLTSKPSELSGGERQRVAIARAIVRKPSVFLLDEPLSNLDAQLRSSTRTELKLLQRQLGVTTVYVTHDQVEAMTLGHRIAILNNGKIEQVGAPDELYDNPANIFVASFIGSPPINLIETQCMEHNGIRSINIGGTNLRLASCDKSVVAKGECIAGIRPEHIYLADKNDKGVVPVKISSVEVMGKDVIIYLTGDNVNLAMIASNKDLREGEQVYARLDMDKIHIFQ